MNKTFVAFIVSAAVGTVIGVAYVSWKAQAAQSVATAAGNGVANMVSGLPAGIDTALQGVSPAYSGLSSLYNEFFN